MQQQLTVYVDLLPRESCETCISGHAGEPQIAPDPNTRQHVALKLEETQKYLKAQADFKAKILGTCRNLDKYCAYKAVLGECETNKAFMQANCAPACQMCR